MSEENDLSEIDDIDLSSLSNEDLVAQMHDDLYDGLGAVSYTHLRAHET